MSDPTTSGRVSGLASLREPFDPALVGKLPRVTCRTCSDRQQQCTEHRRQRCEVCQAYISTAHIHLDFVGHAHVTDRLLTVDPFWTWEPMAYDEDGLPRLRFVGNGRTAELWVRLTVLGVTRPGVGTAAAEKDDRSKELVSDALRNAAMRFGVALGLWAKSELESEHDTPPADPQPSGPPPPPEGEAYVRESWDRSTRETIREAGLKASDVQKAIRSATGGRTHRLAEVYQSQADDVEAELDALIEDYAESSQTEAEDASHES